MVLPPAAIAAGLPDAAFSMAGPAFGAAYAIWDAPEQDAANVAWLRATADRLAPVTLGHYVGEADLDRPGWLEACYAPEALGRLRALQVLHDPLGRLRARGGGAGAGAARRLIPAAVNLG